MNYDFSPHLLLRRPVKNRADYSAEPQIFLDDLFFRTAIRVATPAFFNLLERQQFQAEKLSTREANTLQKYINRYCYRPTPFGLFASISLRSWRDQPGLSDHSASFRAFISVAMPMQNLLGKYLLDHGLKEGARFQSNPSLYRVLNEYRFFRTGVDEAGQREYQLQSIAFSKVLKDLLTGNPNGYLRQGIVSQIAGAANCAPAEAEDYADFLIDAQLLIDKDQMNITGPDYLEGLAKKLEEGHLKNNLFHVFAALKDPAEINLGFIDQVEQSLQAISPASALAADKLNIILKRQGTEEQPGMGNQDKLRDGISALALLSPTGQSAAMSQFIQSFQQHFEGQTQPLLRALDPEAGVGYQQPETEKNNALLETLHIPYRNQPKQNVSWSAAHSLLMECWLRDKSEDPVIRIANEDLERLKSGYLPEQLLGMSVLFRITGDKVFIENAGGINAPALIGRFTVAGDEIALAAQEMALQLEKQNPDIIFAELLHLADPHTDNVNHRKHIYHYELPVTAASTLPAERQIQLSDLYIRIIDNRAMLFSGQHQKFVIPRLSSAYNHSLNKLPLFRFLADLPYQYGRSNLGIELRQFFPGLGFYPRVEYKESILSLATWVIKEEQISKLQAERNDISDIFYVFSNNIRLPRYFSLAQGDQELVFDGESERDRIFFFDCIRQKKEVILKEFLNQPEVKQYNAYLLPAEPLVLPSPEVFKNLRLKTQRKYVPGSSWLYLKIYAPKIGADRLLLQLAPLLVRRYEGYKISQWFFIRYEDHAPHIRLRLQVNPDSINQLLLAFKAKLEDRIQQHVIREFQIDTYSRELERYSAGGIENSERFFWASSELVLSFLKKVKKKPVASSHAFAMYSTYVMIREFIRDPDEQLRFTLDSFQQFLPEFTDKPFKVELDKKFRELTGGILSAFQLTDPGLLSGSVKAGENFRQSLQVIQQHMAGETDHNYLRSIIHMHLNRVFTDESRKQEMICYYLLHKYLLSVKGRIKRSN